MAAAGAATINRIDRMEAAVALVDVSRDREAAEEIMSVVETGAITTTNTEADRRLTIHLGVTAPMIATAAAVGGGSTLFTSFTYSSLCSSDEDNAESESDAESKRLLQMRLQMRELANEEDSSDNDNTSDIYSTSAKARSEASQPSRTSSGLETESTDTDSSESADDYAFQTLLKPMFVPKSQRLSQPHAKDQEAGSMDGEDIAVDDKADRKRQARRDESIRMAAEEAARSRQQPDIDDVDELNVDDTDDVDVEAEFEMWRIREISRNERDEAEKGEAYAEEEEREQAQNMTEEEKNRAGLERARKQREAKAQERAELAETFTRKKQHDSSASMNDKMTQDMLEYALHRNSGRKGNSKWRGYGKEDTSRDRSLWDEGARQGRKR
ncbi:hypothetical protein GGI22_004641 [Coemansia erecta]|nr:hypothetical protein GGI22_004641 [Coemansia erecta]